MKDFNCDIVIVWGKSICARKKFSNYFSYFYLDLKKGLGGKSLILIEPTLMKKKSILRLVVQGVQHLKKKKIFLMCVFPVNFFSGRTNKSVWRVNPPDH